MGKYNLEPKEVAQQLFPGNKYPRLALNRVISGGSVLDANQVSKLALLVGLPIDELYNGGNWKAKSMRGLHIFTNEEYRAELNTETWVTKIFHKDSLLHESIIHSGAIPLNEYLHKLEIQIEKFKTNE